MEAESTVLPAPDVLLAQLRQHLHQLVQVAQTLQSENQTLRQMARDQQRELQTQSELILRLRTERDSLKQAVESEPQRTAQLKAQIDALIAQIDTRLSQLPPE